MHTGTQTIIQALQAVPWVEDPDNEDDYMNHDVVAPAETESDEEEKGEVLEEASSHRPNML